MLSFPRCFVIDSAGLSKCLVPSHYRYSSSARFFKNNRLKYGYRCPTGVGGGILGGFVCVL